MTFYTCFDDKGEIIARCQTQQEIDVLRRMGRDGITVHGFRSTFRDWAGETTGFPREVIEAALAHGIKDKAEAAYARSDLFAKRRDLMDAWANVATATQRPDNVIAIA